MSKHAADPGTAQAFVETRRARIADAVARPLSPAASDTDPLSPERLAFFRKEAEDLYWNELAWEELTDEELVVGGHLTEMVFPGFLAFVEALLVDRAPVDSLALARPHPDAVEEILTFLGERCAETSAQLEAGVDSQRVVWARLMTCHLVDLVLYRLHGLTPAERERLEDAR
ncbi:MAG TPA: hypothetical protein VGR37_03580 [Longimicrobiaceae bacterium]|nr:hypothetical protein [Longimicrobiaceae bacterium]